MYTIVKIRGGNFCIIKTLYIPLHTKYTDDEDFSKKYPILVSTIDNRSNGGVLFC